MLSVYAGRLSFKEAPAVLDRLPTGEPDGARVDRGWREEVKRRMPADQMDCGRRSRTGRR